MGWANESERGKWTEKIWISTNGLNAPDPYKWYNSHYIRQTLKARNCLFDGTCCRHNPSKFQNKTILEQRLLTALRVLQQIVQTQWSNEHKRMYSMISSWWYFDRCSSSKTNSRWSLPQRVCAKRGLLYLSDGFFLAAKVYGIVRDVCFFGHDYADLLRLTKQSSDRVRERVAKAFYKLSNKRTFPSFITRMCNAFA